MCSLGSCQREALLPSLGAGPAATVFSLARPGWLSGFRSLGPPEWPQRLFDCSNLALEQSPLTESNRRPSPYHLGHKDPLRSLMQARGSYRPDGADAVWRGCCTFVLHMASSSRSQIHAPPRCHVACLTLEQSSANVHWRTLAAGGIVTQLVTRCRPDPLTRWAALQTPCEGAPTWASAGSKCPLIIVAAGQFVTRLLAAG